MVALPQPVVGCQGEQVHPPEGSLRSAVNGRYVCAENAGDGSLIANRDAIGLWETFDLVTG